MNKAYKIMVEKREWKKLLGRRSHRWEDNIKMYVNKLGGCELDISGSGQETVVGLCEHGNEPPISIKRGEIVN
jgi:hypothetical protein